MTDFPYLLTAQIRGTYYHFAILHRKVLAICDRPHDRAMDASECPVASDWCLVRNHPSSRKEKQG